MSYLGKAPGAPGGVRQVYEFVATAGQTTFSGVDRNGAILTYEPGFANVFVGGVMLSQTDVTASSGSSIVLPYGLAAGKIVQVEAFGTFKVADALPISGGTLTGYVSGLTAARGDYSKLLATTEFVQCNGLAFRPGGHGLGTNTTLGASDMNGWGQIQAAGVTVTLPLSTAVAGGSTYTVQGGIYGGTLKASGAESIVDMLANGTSSYYVGPNETVTVVNNVNYDYGWYVVGASGRGAGGFRSLNAYAASVALSAAHANSFVTFHGSATNQTITLPQVASLPVNGAQTVMVRNIANQAVTVAAYSGETITNSANGNLSSMVLQPGQSLWVVNQGSNTFWDVIGGSQVFDVGSLISGYGYQKLSSGLIVQWGSASTTSGRASVTWPIAYTTACYTAAALHNGGGGAVIIIDNVYGGLGTTAGKFGSSTTLVGLDGSLSFNWMSIGK